MRKRIADFTVRAAAAVGGLASEPGKSLVSTLTYRLAGAIVSVCGGRLESRIMSFVVPDGKPDEKVVRVLDGIRTELASRGASLRVAEVQLSREEALQSEDVRPLVPEGAGSMTYYQLFVPTHSYWKASILAQNAIERLRESEAETLHNNQMQLTSGAVRMDAARS